MVTTMPYFEPVYASVSGATWTTALDVAFYRAGTATLADALGADDQLVITNVELNQLNTTIALALFNSVDAAPQTNDPTSIVARLRGTTTVSRDYGRDGLKCKKGVGLKVRGSSDAQAEFSIYGYIIRQR